MNAKPIFIAIASGSIALVAVVGILVRRKFSGGLDMKISNNGLNTIKQFEGCRLTAYQDVKGVWTIGYGHTGGVYYGQTITQAEADTLFRQDLAKFESGVARLCYGVTLTQNQFDALVSFAYNCGLSALGSSTLLKKIKANPNDKSIAAEFKKWCYSGGKIVQGLANRRTAEAQLYFL